MTISAETQIDSLLITPREAGQRIDKLLAETYPDFSRTYFQKLISDGFVLLNGKIVKKRIAPEVGDEIEVCFQITPESQVEPEEIPLDILFEDDFIIAVNKPAGMVVHPAPGHPNGTFVNALLGHCRGLKAQFNDTLRPGIVHRLDRDTSGVLIAAKTVPAHQKLVEMFSARLVEKQYLAICLGRPPNMTIDAPIGRHPTQRQEMAVVPDHGKDASTRIEVLAFNAEISLVKASPKTGRTHQIRVHLRHIGHPIIGDSLYGNDLFKAERQLLHAYRLNLAHPITGEPLSFLAPIPADFKEWIARIASNFSF